MVDVHSEEERGTPVRMTVLIWFACLFFDQFDSPFLAKPNAILAPIETLYVAPLLLRFLNP